MHLLNKHRPTDFIAHLCLCLLSIGTAISAEPLFDPTQPYGERNAPRLGTNRGAAPPLQLEAILHSSERRLAIVNGQLVREGERIANNLIEAITPTTVRYSTKGEPHTLTLAATILPVEQLSIRPAALSQPTKQPFKDNQP